MKNILSKISLLFMVLVVAVVGFSAVAPHHVLAQSTATTGLSDFAAAAGFGAEQDPRLIVARIIRTGLTFLGIIAVVIVMYGGFTWMTAGGDETKVDKAKKILVNGSIGLLIILLSFAITSFIINALTGATGSGTGGGTGGGGSSYSLGGGSSSSFAVTAFRPKGTTTIRNIQLRITFSSTVDAASVEGNISVVNAETGAVVLGTLSTSGNAVGFVPLTPCPEPNSSRFCFDVNSTYNVTVASGVKSASGTAITCSTSLPCTSSFTTGELIDTEPPVASMSLPENNSAVSVDSSEPVEVTATDDSEVSDAEFAADSVAFDVVPASGDNLAQVVIDSSWDTVGLITGQSYALTATVSDIAGNTDADSVTVRARAQACFDGIADGAETGVDCGGDQGSLDYCGACAGEACVTSADCGSGTVCQSFVCVAVPTINSISPLNGAPGTFVTISGAHFGSLTGQVYFTSAAGTTLAAFPACSTNTWSDGEVTVMVPNDAVSGPIRLATSNGQFDWTDDDNGPMVDDYLVDDTVHPKLCSLSPVSGASASALTLSGQTFGTTQDSSVVNFGTSKQASSYSSWSDTSITANVPAAADGAYSVYATVGNERSNALTYSITSVTSTTPSITGISPSSGGIGRYVSVEGAGFGSSIGTVHLQSRASGDDAVGSLDFPADCTATTWSDSHVQFIVPGKFTNGTTLGTGDYDVYVVTSTGATSGTIPFTVTSGTDTTPEICSISPAEGAVGDVVTLVGQNLGATAGSVTFTSSIASTISSWSSTEVKTTVPSGAVTGQVTLKNSSGTAANDEYFTVTSGVTAATTAPTAAAYVWSFSTGQIPTVPEVTIACTDTDVSGVPNSQFTSSVCTNAVVFAELTEPMNIATLADAITVERCMGSGTNPCSTTATVTGMLTTTSTSFTFTPSSLVVSATYRVTIAKTAESTNGVALAKDVSWSFVTSADTKPCSIEKVVVSPNAATVTETGDTQKFLANPVNGCVVLNSNTFSWTWSINQSYASFTTADTSCLFADSPSCANARALAQGTTDVTAKETGSSISGSGTLTINFTDPYVNDYWPSCTAACTNAEVGASFNTAMDSASIEAAGNVKLYTCANELCTNLTEVTGVTARCTKETDSLGNISCTGFTLSGESLVAAKYYRVVVSGNVKSSSKVPLTEANYGADYSWTFRVNPDGSACAVDRVGLSPASVILSAVGDTSAFSATAYSGADSCSASGERVSAFDYSWGWVDPVDGNLDGDANTVVAKWFNGISNALVDSSPAKIPVGCTAECTAAGSTAQGAICGNGKIEVGESCDDANILDSDGCSASCLREGSGFVGTCGNGKVDRTLTTSAGEDCDDGGTVSGDGCSAECLAEGSRSVGATCGNSDVAYNTLTFAGEQCDDSNAVSGDGCSANCLLEGSPTLTSIGGAICGNNIVEAPAENCDDNNTDRGDGCSDACLLEGSSKSYGSTCGNGGILETGEECDDGGVINGDGCSSKCLLEGSSTAYTKPSFCGDGVTGRGEVAMCEVGTGADSKIDPIQVAKITHGAVREIDPATNKASATIQVSYSGLSTTADLSLSCAAVKDSDCRDSSEEGVGVGNCCIPRPTVTITPSGTCRNAALYAVFSEEMDLSTFTRTDASSVIKHLMYAKLDTSSTGGVCPTGHVALGSVPNNIFARVWHGLVRFVTGQIVSAATGDCLLPVDSYEQVAAEDGTYRIYLHYSQLLAAGGKYTLVVTGDEDTGDEIVEGVRSSLGVGVNGTRSSSFTVSDMICSLDALNVTDTDSSSPNVFTHGDESHAFEAQGVSYASGVATEIESVSGSYSWDISSWAVDEAGLFEATQDATNHAEAEIATLGQNGQATLAATATIEDDVFNVSTGSTVMGTADITAELCENPWPGLAFFPWVDDATSQASGLASKGAGWTNFSTYYCRDAGTDGTADDLPSLTVVRPPISQATNVLKEYLFEVADGSGDAIGVRVISNAGYLSPSAWYAAQGFSGSLQATSIDGFDAVTDGRTTYVAAPNENDSTLYSNIYAVTYNEGASANAKNIYNQMLASMQFATNVSAVGFCASATTTECSSDADCQQTASADTCADKKAKLRRDTRRLADLTDLRSAVQGYKEINGVVPALSAGTYVAGFGSSAWSSWNEILGGAIGSDALATDPLNEYAGCGTGSYASYESATCTNLTTGEYVCPSGSYAYHYKTYGQNSAYLYGDLEYTEAAWYSDIDSDGLADGVAVVAGNTDSSPLGFSSAAFCGGTVYGASSICGDGIVGSGEICEIGQAGGTATACTTDSGAAGTQSQTCNSTCTGYVDNSSATCVTSTCGDGVIGDGETCDDGSLNGHYGYCGTDCTYKKAYSCGDGQLAGGEACDCGSTAVLGSFPVSSDARAYGAEPGSCTAGYNGTYSASPNTSCAWDCSGPAAYCGDGNVDSGEICDGTDATYDGKLCSTGPNKGEKCTTVSDCGGLSNSCGGGSGVGNYAACASGYTRTRLCNDTAGGTCKYKSTWEAQTCTKIGSCGDGNLDEGEECDDGNTDSTDSCTASCKANVCGDSYLYSGVEECDLGTANGTACSSSYGSTCAACSVSCKNVVSSGAYCGDGVINGSEYCDGNSVSYTYYDATTDTTNGACFTLGATVTVSGVTYTCRDLGICSGGSSNGEYCTSTSSIYTTCHSKSDCESGICNMSGITKIGTCEPVDQAFCTASGSTCVKPVCNSTCSNTCPFNMSSAPLEITANLPGSAPASSVYLYSYSSSSTSTLPNAATITVPACSVAASLQGSIHLTSVTPAQTYVVFALDRSKSMNSTLDTTTRSAAAESVLASTVTDLYTELGSKVHIGLVGFADYAGDGMCSTSSYSCSVFEGNVDSTNKEYWSDATSSTAAGAAALDSVPVDLLKTTGDVSAAFETAADAYALTASAALAAEAAAKDVALSAVTSGVKSLYSDAKSAYKAAATADQAAADAAAAVKTSSFDYYSCHSGGTCTSSMSAGEASYADGSDVAAADAAFAAAAAADAAAQAFFPPACGTTAYDQCVSNLGFVNQDDESTILARLTQLGATDGGAETDYAFTAAKNLLDTVSDVDNVRKVIVLLSDGSSSTKQSTVKAAAQAAKDAGYEVYTVALSTGSTFIEHMEEWSSNTSGLGYNEETNIDYAYDTSTVEGLGTAYESIFSSIYGVVVSVSSSDGSATYQTTATLKEGSGEAFPWPEKFVCDPTQDQEIPIQIIFTGVGQVELSGVSLDYCAP